METLFPGLSAMENIHPVFVHFPVVLLPLALVLQALAVWRRREDCQRAALWLLWLGTLGALAAAGTGLLAEEKVVVPEPGWEVIELHETLMLVATGLAAALSVLAVVLRSMEEQVPPTWSSSLVLSIRCWPVIRLRRAVLCTFATS